MTAATNTSSITRTRLTPALIITLALLSSVAPFATDLYLSAFPEMTTELSASASGVQLSLTTFLIGAGVGQVIFGPLSDRLGRMGPLLVGLVGYVVVSVVAMFAPTLEILVVARLLQGLSGAAGMVIGRAIITDIAKGPAAARALSVMMLVGAIAPIAAPFMGSLLAPSIGWRGLLGIVAAIGIVAIPLVLLFVRETRPRSVRQRAADEGHEKGRLLSRRYLGYALTYGFAFATMMAYISASPFIYQTMMGFSEVQYGLAFGLNALVMAATGAASARLVGRHGPRALVRLGLSINLASIALFTALAFSGVPAIWLAVPLLFAVGSLGFILGNITALALEAVPGRGGSASAWLGCLQFILAGIVSPLVGLGGEATAIPTALTMLAASLVAVLAFSVTRQGEPPRTPGTGTHADADTRTTRRARRTPAVSARRSTTSAGAAS